MFSNLKIGTRLALAFGLLLALLCVLATVAAHLLWDMNDTVVNYSDNAVPSLQEQNKIGLAVSSLRRWEYRHILLNTSADMDAVEQKISAIHSEINADLDRYAQTLIADAKDKELLDKTRAQLQNYYTQWNTLKGISRLTATDPSKQAEATKFMAGPSFAAFQAVEAAVDAWWKYNVELTNGYRQSASADYQNARILLSVVVVLALVTGGVAAWLITVSIVTPLRQAAAIAARVADGDLTMEVAVRGRDENADLLRALANMTDNLRRIVGQVRHSSDSIATGSSEIAAGNSDLSQRTETQASNLEETAASMEELTSTVRTNADTAQAASKLAHDAARAATQGGEVVQRVVQTMSDIATASHKISDIIGVIDGIAFQTNILALNAAVEAARAGEQGRGFAVVASEVRTLAQRSAGAAKEIKELIQDSTSRVDAGTQQVEEAGRSMSEIVQQVDRVSRLINDIATATQEQSSGINQVGDAIAQLDQVTQQNAALVEESAAAADSLKQQAAALADVVNVFKVHGGGAASVSATANPPSSASSASTSAPPPAAAKPIVVKTTAVARTPTRALASTPSSRPAPAAAPRAAKPVVKINDDEWETF